MPWAEEVPASTWGVLDYGQVRYHSATSSPNIEPPRRIYFFLFIFALSLLWDRSSMNLAQCMHAGCPYIAIWVFILGDAWTGFEPWTGFRQSSVRATCPHVSPPLFTRLSF